jgi:hypothetical protein
LLLLRYVNGIMTILLYKLNTSYELDFTSICAIKY